MALDRVAALRAIADPEQRAREASDLANGLAADISTTRALRNDAAVDALRHGLAAIADIVIVTGLTRHALVVAERRIVKNETTCPTCKAAPGKRCADMPVAANHPQRAAAYTRAHRDEPPRYPDPVAVASDQSTRLADLLAVEARVLPVRDDALQVLWALDGPDGRPKYQPADLARISGLTTARITQKGLRSRDVA